MNNSTKFTIGHISDLHFSSGTDESNPDHKHSTELLVGLEESIGKEEIDFLVVSGDISNYGDRQSLINAQAYLFDQIPLGGGKSTGLGLGPRQIGVIPGNHDAWNAVHSGSLANRRQRSLENFNYAFPGQEIPPTGCRYTWLEKNGCGIYIAFADSCYLGDSEKNTESAFGTMAWDAIAKGKLSVDQAETLLEWHDLGSKGQLPNPMANLDGSPVLIDAAIFAQSLKILVMHHYLFEPYGHSSEYFMSVKHRDVVFRNIAFSDFDVLLCGHKHHADVNVSFYGEHFDRRATDRYLFNYFRRVIGLASLPVQMEDEKGRRLTKTVTALIGALWAMLSQDGRASQEDELSSELIELLRGGLENPDGLEHRIKTFLSEAPHRHIPALERHELKNISRRIRIELSHDERKKLKAVEHRIVEISKSLGSRSFLQLMSGSSAKASSSGKERTFQIYDVEYEIGRRRWTVRSRRYLWDSNTFASQPKAHVHEFNRLE